MPGSVIPVGGLVLGPVGSISQTDFPLVSPRQVQAADTLNLNFGEPAVLNLNNTNSSVAQFILGGGTLKSFMPIGIAKDTVLTNAYYPVGGGTSMPAAFYPPGFEMANILTRGTIVAAILNGTPPGAGSPAYIRTALNGAIPLGLVGQFEAVPDGAAAAVAGGGNTGNTTLSAVTVGSLAQAGAYIVTWTDATHFQVTDTSGNIIGVGVNGTPFVSSGVNFSTTTGGTPMVKGDFFTITTTMKTVVVPNIVFKSGILSTDPVSGQISAQLTLLNRLMC